ncbi:MAG: hypothetical protein KJ011_03235 [Burkholderiaceae bacterium]|nr:hypothetical protein [Burkholderiaceae bacterium]
MHQPLPIEIAHAAGALRAAGQLALADWVERLNSSPAEFCTWLASRGLITLKLVEPSPPPARRTGNALDLLLDPSPVRVVDGRRVEPVVLKLRGRWLVGPAGRERLDRPLWTLLQACERPGEVVKHGYTLGSAERRLRDARAALRKAAGLDPLDRLTITEATAVAQLWVPVRVVHDTDDL